MPKRDLVRRIDQGRAAGGGSSSSGGSGVSAAAPLTVSSGQVRLRTDAEFFAVSEAGELALAAQAANTVLAGPVSGAAAAPTFRALTAANDVTDALLHDGSRSLTGDLDFDGYRAIALACDNGTSFPATPSTGQWYYRTDVDTLFLYEAAWKPIVSFSALALYVDGASGSDATGKGYAAGADACATLAYAWSLIPGVFGGDVTIYLAAGSYVHPTSLSGKTPNGAFKVTIQGATTTLLAATSPTAATAGSISTNSTITVSTANWGLGIIRDSGTNSSVTASKLVDATQNFVTTARVGMQVKNTTDNTWAHVTAVDSNTTLTLDADIFTATGKDYQIGWGELKGGFIVWADATATTGLRGQITPIYEHTSTVLTLVGRNLNESGDAPVTPTTSDEFSVVCPAVTFTSGGARVTVEQDYLVYKYVNFDSATIWRFWGQSNLTFRECWINRATIQLNCIYPTLNNCYVFNGSGTYTLGAVVFSGCFTAFVQKCIFNLAEYSFRRIDVVRGAALFRTTNRYCNIIENGSVGLYVDTGASLYSEVISTRDTGWQFYRCSTAAIQLQNGSTRSGTTDIFLGNTENVVSMFLPAEAHQIRSASAPTTRADTVWLWGADQNGEAGNSGLHVLSETGNTLKFGNRLAWSGGLQRRVTAKSASFTASIAEQVYNCDASTAAIAVTLPSPSSCYDSAITAGTIMQFLKLDTSRNPITLIGTCAGETPPLRAAGQSMTIQSDGAYWRVIQMPFLEWITHDDGSLTTNDEMIYL